MDRDILRHEFAVISFQQLGLSEKIPSVAVSSVKT